MATAEHEPVDSDRLLQAVERLAQTLELFELPRMAARVFAYVLAEDSDRYTAAELAEGLRVSPAAISGAVRFLHQTGLLIREREPGRRGDLYRINDADIWRTIMQSRMALVTVFDSGVDEALDLLGPDSRGGRRLVETREFFDFLATEMEGVLERWTQHRARLSPPPG